MLNYDLSLIFALAVEAQPHLCWTNAANTVIAFPGFFDGGSYVEGWMVLCRRQVELVEHGWCELPDGSIIDPSIVFLAKEHVKAEYFPGVRLSRKEVIELYNTMLPHVRHTGAYGYDGFGHPDYRRAYEKAETYARSYAQATSAGDIKIYRMEYDPGGEEDASQYSSQPFGSCDGKVEGRL
jgi:hypothetical protein